MQEEALDRLEEANLRDLEFINDDVLHNVVLDILQLSKRADNRWVRPKAVVNCLF